MLLGENAFHGNSAIRNKLYLQGREYWELFTELPSLSTLKSEGDSFIEITDIDIKSRTENCS